MYRRAPAGLIDAGASSLASLAVGLYVVRVLSPADVGLWALLFSAFILVGLLPTQLAFFPAEVRALQWQRTERLGLLGQAVRLGFIPCFLAAAGFLLAARFAPADESESLVAFAAAGTAAVVLSPIRDHVRRVLHLAGFPWRAASMSVVMLLSVVTALPLLSAIRHEIWAPFGSLALANAAAIAAGLWLVPGKDRIGSPRRLERKELAASGRWLFAAAAAPAGAALAAGVIVVRTAGAETLGFVESARMVGQPLVVLGTGLSAVLGPLSMEAAACGNQSEARRVSRVFLTTTVVCGFLYLLLFGVPWSASPLPALLPNAYAIGGLVAITIIANGARGITLPFHCELLGGRRERRLAALELRVGFLHIAIASTSVFLQAFAIPVGLLIGSLVRGIAYKRHIQQLYGSLHRRPKTGQRHQGLQGATTYSRSTKPMPSSKHGASVACLRSAVSSDAAHKCHSRRVDTRCRCWIRNGVELVGPQLHRKQGCIDS